jgi:hypothetical protein
MDGAGTAPPKAELGRLTDILVRTFPASFPFPFVCPTTDGGVFLEWESGDWTVSAEFQLPGPGCVLQATNAKTGETVDEEVKLRSASDCGALYAFLRQYL